VRDSRVSIIRPVKEEFQKQALLQQLSLLAITSNADIQDFLGNAILYNASRTYHVEEQLGLNTPPRLATQ
jgi:hypothetical protein